MEYNIKDFEVKSTFIARRPIDSNRKSKIDELFQSFELDKSRDLLKYELNNIYAMFSSTGFSLHYDDIPPLIDTLKSIQKIFSIDYLKNKDKITFIININSDSMSLDEQISAINKFIGNDTYLYSNIEIFEKINNDESPDVFSFIRLCTGKTALNIKYIINLYDINEIPTYKDLVENHIQHFIIDKFKE